MVLLGDGGTFEQWGWKILRYWWNMLSEWIVALCSFSS